jgi:methylenetetrahydrofolate dehydrogenase (NADP+)/methenyltetrahydrofolate cyclohydrolase
VLPHVDGQQGLVGGGQRGAGGAGVSGLVRGEHLKKGAVVIDFGYGRNAKGELEGDVDFESSKDIASYLTPTRGGMGPIVVAMLFSNFYRLVG